mgnify:CR=1 FL=1|jgi:hypothetical protein
MVNETNEEIADLFSLNVDEVIDGDLDEFIDTSYLHSETIGELLISAEETKEFIEKINQQISEIKREMTRLRYLINEAGR